MSVITIAFPSGLDHPPWVAVRVLPTIGGGELAITGGAVLVGGPGTTEVWLESCSVFELSEAVAVSATFRVSPTSA
jgi:hypothetical protein